MRMGAELTMLCFKSQTVVEVGSFCNSCQILNMFFRKEHDLIEYHTVNFSDFSHFYTFYTVKLLQSLCLYYKNTVNTHLSLPSQCVCLMPLSVLLFSRDYRCPWCWGGGNASILYPPRIIEFLTIFNHSSFHHVYSV